MSDPMDAAQFDSFIKRLEEASKSLTKIADQHGKPNDSGAPNVNKEFKGLAGITHNLTNKFEKYSNATDKINRHIDGFASSIKLFGGSLENAASALGSFVKLLPGGALLNDLAGSLTRMNNTYKDLNNYGQTFGGSMIELAKQAGEAGLPLGDFAEMLKHSSTVAAILADDSTQAGKSLGVMQKTVRSNIEQFGLYGMSLREVGELTGDYAETLRLTGDATLRNKDASAKNISQFAKDISAFSAATGKDRRQIANITNDAMRDVSLYSKNLTDSQRVTITKSTAFLAALPGELGQMTSRMLTQTIGRGAVYLADDAKTFIDAGAGEFLGLMQNFADKTEHGIPTDNDMGDYLDNVHKYTQQNKATLGMLAASGDASAQKVLSYLMQFEGLTKKEFIAKQKEQEKQQGFTRFWERIEDIWANLSGSFNAGMLTALGGLDAFKDENIGEMVKQLGVDFGLLGGTVGKFLKETFTISNIESMITSVKWFVGGIAQIITPIMQFGAFMAKLVSYVTYFTNQAGILATGIALLAGAFALKGISNIIVRMFEGIIGNMFGMKLGTMAVKAGVVNVNGGAGGLGGGGGGGGGSGDHSIKKKQTSAERAAERSTAAGQSERKARAAQLRAERAAKRAATPTPPSSGGGRWGGLLKTLGFGAAALVGGGIGLGMFSGSAHAAEMDKAPTKKGIFDGPEFDYLNNLYGQGDGTTAAPAPAAATPAAASSTEGSGIGAGLIGGVGGALTAGLGVSALASLVKGSSGVSTAAATGGSMLSRGLSAAKGIGKGALKFIPGIGAAFILSSAAARASEGDMFGASVDTLSAGLDATGIGSIPSAMLQAGMAGRDMLGFGGGSGDKTSGGAAPGSVQGFVQRNFGWLPGVTAATPEMAAQQTSKTAGEKTPTDQLIQLQKETVDLLQKLYGSTVTGNAEQIKAQNQSNRYQAQAANAFGSC